MSSNCGLSLLPNRDHGDRFNRSFCPAVTVSRSPPPWSVGDVDVEKSKAVSLGTDLCQKQTSSN